MYGEVDVTVHKKTSSDRLRRLFHKCWKTQALFMENQFGGRRKRDWKVRLRLEAGSPVDAFAGMIWA